MDIVSRVIKKVKELRDVTPGPHYAVIDLDRTTIFNDCAEGLLNSRARHGGEKAVNDFREYYAKRDSGDTEAADRFCATTLKGLAVKDMDSLVRSVMAYEKTLPKEEVLLGRNVARGILPRPSVIELIGRLQECRVSPWIVSASPELVVRSVVKHFHIDVDDVIGVRNVVVDGIITGELEEPVPMYAGKVKCIQQRIDPTTRPLFGIGDSMGDLAMLLYSLVQGVIDAPNSNLFKEVNSKNWYLLK